MINSIAPREWKTGPKFISGLTAAEAIIFGSWYFCEMNDGKCEMQTATISLMEITSEIMRKAVTNRVTAVSDVIYNHLSCWKQLSFSLSFFVLSKLRSVSLCTIVQTNKPEPSKKILTKRPYQTLQGCSGVSIFGISTQWDLEIGNGRFVLKIFFPIQ